MPGHARIIPRMSFLDWEAVRVVAMRRYRAGRTAVVEGMEKEFAKAVLAAEPRKAALLWAEAPVAVAIVEVYRRVSNSERTLQLVDETVRSEGVVQSTIIHAAIRSHQVGRDILPA